MTTRRIVSADFLSVPKRSPKRYYGNMTRERAETIRAAYLTKCHCCGRRPTQRELAFLHGITQSKVSAIVSGRVWSQP